MDAVRGNLGCGRNAVFRLTPSELVKITGGRVVSVK